MGPQVMIVEGAHVGKRNLGVENEAYYGLLLS